MSVEGVCWLDGSIMPLEQAKISVLDHGLLYGDGVFEGIRFYSGRPFLLEDHLKRLADSAHAIALQLPYTINKLADIVEEVVNAFGHPDGYIRLVVTRGKGPLGINPATCPAPSLFAIASQLQLMDKEAMALGVRTIISSTRKLTMDGLDPRVKSLNYLNNILAKIEANRSGVEEALMLNQQGFVTEGTADNVFIVRNDCLLTPPASDGALDGITRKLIMQLAGTSGIEVREQSLAPYDLYTADECFLTGTGAELIPVREVNGRLIHSCPGPVYFTLIDAFHRTIQSRER